MPGNMTPPPPELSLEDQADQIKNHAIGLFSASEHRFGGCFIRGVETGGDTAFRDKVRHSTATGMVTINPLDFSVDGAMIVDPEAPVEVSIDTALPATLAWPNTYVREGFLLGAHEDLRTMDTPYVYELTVQEFASDGRHISDGGSIGLLSEPGHTDQESGDGIDRELALMVGAAEAQDDTGPELTLQGRKLAVMRRIFPEIMEPFQDPCLPERFQEVFRLVMALEPRHTEVGCEPNPYIRVS